MHHYKYCNTIFHLLFCIDTQTGPFGYSYSTKASGFNLTRVSRLAGGHVGASPDGHGIQEVLMEMGSIFDHSVFLGSRDADVIKHGQVLNVLAQSDTTCVVSSHKITDSHEINSHQINSQ